MLSINAEWCNGSTSDSDSLSLGSTPSSATSFNDYYVSSLVSA